MIRNNKHLKPKAELHDNILLHYRNAVYQGQYDHEKEQRRGRGILYFPTSHQFIACNHFKGSRIADLTLFFNSHARYAYGEWKEGLPNGLSVFRMNEILIITQYREGQLKPGTNILFIFEKYCLGVIIETEENNHWSIRSKSEVFGIQQMQGMISQCGFDCTKVSPSLIKFLNQQFPSQISNSFKLRLIKNQYYRFGFDSGLAVFFDDEHQIISVGQHERNELGGVGIKYGSQEMGGFTEEGIFDGCNTFAFQRGNKPDYRIGQTYSRFHLSAVNFKNQFVTNPSEKYFLYFENLMKENGFIDLFNQLVLNSSLLDVSPPQKRYEKLQFQQMQFPTFKKTFRQSVKQTPIFLDEPTSKRKIDNESGSFERLSERNRLQIMKKQLFGSITPKEFPAKIVPERSFEHQSSRFKKQQSSRIKNSEKQFIKDIKSEKQSIREIKEEKQQKGSDSASDRRSQRSRNANLEQKIDIIIREPPPPPQPQPQPQESFSRSKSKKKIFELTKSIKRDYSPETQVSPFKSRMKARIFDQSYSPSRSKSRKRQIFKEQVNSKSATRIKYLDQYKSPHQQLGFSALKSSSSSQIGNFPVTLSKQTRNHQKSRESDVVEDQESSNLRTIQQSKTNLKQNFKIKQEEHSSFKRGNKVYRNPMIKGGYNEYVYEPINVKTNGNSPYTKNASQKSLSRNKSSHQLAQLPETSKKIIGESSPYKKKMGNYLSSEDEVKMNEKYSHYKKRTGYF